MIENPRTYWTQRWQNNETGWDIGYASSPLMHYIQQIENKQLKILIPGCGNAWEADALHKLGFKNVYVLDISEVPLKLFSERLPSFPKAHLICSDFFEHEGKYDLILEQTFFCALNPALRSQYASKMHQLLVPNGKLVGVLFGVPKNSDKPPFGGSKEEYIRLFEPLFDIKKLEGAYNSIPPRINQELFFHFVAKTVKTHK